MPRQYTRKPLASRFWAKVNKDGPIVRPELGPCWEWIGSRFKSSGYGSLNSGGKNGVPLYAHRVSYELAYGPLRPGMDACHHCDNRRCVRPDHLFEGTALDNARDAKAKGRLSYGERCPQAKLTAQAVKQIRQRYTLGGVSQRRLAQEYGVSQMAISQVVTGRNWKHVT